MTNFSQKKFDLLRKNRTEITPLKKLKKGYMTEKSYPNQNLICSEKFNTNYTLQNIEKRYMSKESYPKQNLIYSEKIEQKLHTRKN